MFRVDFYVDDKRLGAALLALVGIAHGQPGVTPVVNVKKKGNGLAPVAQGNTMERFAQALQEQHKGKTIKAADVREMMKPLGLSAKSYSYLLKNAIDSKMMKKTGTGQGTKTRYVVL